MKVGKQFTHYQFSDRLLEQQLENSHLEVGADRVRWDGPTLVVYLKRRFGINVKVLAVDFSPR